MFELLDFIPAPVYLKDINGYYIACNNLFSDLFAIKKDDIIGKNIYDFIDGNTASILHKKDQELINSLDKEQNFNHKLLVDNIQYDLLFFKSKITNDNGMLKGLMGVVIENTNNFKKSRGNTAIELSKDINNLKVIVKEDGKCLDILLNEERSISKDKVTIIGKYLFKNDGKTCNDELMNIIKNTIAINKQYLYSKDILVNNKTKRIEIKITPLQLYLSGQKVVLLDIAEQDLTKMIENDVKVNEIVIHRSNIINQIINETYSYEKGYIDIVKSVGIDLHKGLICLLISVQGIDVNKSPIINLLSHNSDNFVWDCDKFIGIYFYEKDKDRCLNQQHIEYIKKTILEKYNNYIINIGVSGIKKGLRSLQEGFNEAELALSSLMQQHNDNNDICYFEKLGILQLLVGSDYNKEFICQFIDSKIGKIIRYDQEKNTELLETLEELIYVDNLKKVAEKLYLHHKTVVFRKQRIEQILDLSIDSFEVKMTLATAIKLHKLNKCNKVLNNDFLLAEL